jgi:hypothetical protein
MQTFASQLSCKLSLLNFRQLSCKLSLLTSHQLSCKLSLLNSHANSRFSTFINAHANSRFSTLNKSQARSLTAFLTFVLQEFVGNNDCTTVKLNILKVPIDAKFLRIVPKLWKDKIALKVQLFGCSVHQVPGKTTYHFIQFVFNLFTSTWFVEYRGSNPDLVSHTEGTKRVSPK